MAKPLAGLSVGLGDQIVQVRGPEELRQPAAGSPGFGAQADS